jgi:glycosyltransferase involved in cell wall biosynthesis
MDEVAALLATIAIPTFNRVERLKRAVASARAQDYRSVEILIVDNASEDSTTEVCHGLAEEDPRIRYIRQARNVGPVSNFETGLENAQGYYFMWLSDDDWITPNYVRRCAEELEEGRHRIVAGRDYWNTGDRVVAEPIVTAMEPEPVARMLNYLKVVASNAAMSGLSRTDDLRAQLPISGRVAGDWLWLLAILSKGTLGVAADAHIYRDRGGVSSSFHDIAVQLGYGRFTSRVPRTLALINVFTALARGKDFRISETRSSRLHFLAKAAFVATVRLNPLGDLMEPTKLTLKRLLPSKIYDVLRSCYHPILSIHHRIRSRLLAPQHQPAGRG